MARAQILEIQERGPNPRKVQRAVSLLQMGGIVAYPTDTVYGLACDLHDRKAIDRLYRIKGLPRGSSANIPMQFGLSGRRIWPHQRFRLPLAQTSSPRAIHHYPPRFTISPARPP